MRRLINVFIIVSLALVIIPIPGKAAVSSPNFWADWFFVHTEIKATPAGIVTAVWANQTHLDLFMTSSDGTVWSSWWEAAPGWQPWFIVHPEIKAAPGAPVTAVWANSSHLDLFVTGSDGTIWSTWWEPGPGWQPWFSIHPETTAAPGARVTSVWANSTHLDLFMTGSDGTVWSTWWEAGPGWQSWFSIQSATKAAPGAPITAVWANTSHLDLFMAGNDGTVYSTWWEAAAGWQPWFSIYPQTKAAPGAQVTAVWANSIHLDLFMADSNGTVFSSWFEAQYSFQPWFSIHPETKVAPGAAVTALWSTPDHLDLFATTSAGTLETTWWELASSWQAWGAIHPENQVAGGAPITALWANPNHLDLFFTSPDGTVTSTFFDLADSPKWGLLENPGFDGQLVKSVYFFAGDWNHGDALPPFYEHQTPPRNDNLYTVYPSDPRDLGWSESLANREYAVDSMINAGTNVVTMSYWGEPGTDRWVFSAPMQTATEAHDELFDVAMDRNILILPAIESADAGKCHPGGISPAFQFASDFPGSQASPSPALVTQIEDLVTRYIKLPANPKWKDRWAQIYDRNGVKRYAINILHVASNQIAGNDDRTFASGFDWVANKVFEDKQVLVGFTLDLLPLPTPVKNDCSGTTVMDTYTASGSATGPYLRLSSSVLAVQDFFPEVSAKTSDESLLVMKKNSYMQQWKAAGIPVYLDVDPGYDGHLVFPDSQIWGNNANWRHQLSNMRKADYKGITFNSWNGYTEGTAAVKTTASFGSDAYPWLTELFGGTMPTVVYQTHSTYVKAGQSAVLNVIATGDTPLSFQWYQGYAGQTSMPVSTSGPMTDTFVTPPITKTMHYWVRTSNLAGSADSPTYTVSAYDPSLNIFLPLSLK